jgi:asparagine synthase (glutamine-hydrolysing)
MCGITGIWQRDHRPIERATIQRMTDSLMHRGPDAGALWVSGDLGLGHRRLSVIDLSAHAAQPIWLPDRSLAMVYNGEIHNYRDLATQLRAAGAILRAENDTEVLLWSYRLWGESCFERLNGMWAAAFWEPAKRTLVLSRDRFGIKPLLYSILGSRVAFASEAKAILTAFPEERRPQRTLGREFLAIRLPDQDAGEATFFENVKSVPAGHFVRIRETSETLHRHWQFRPGTETMRADAPEAFLDLLRDAVSIRLRSDVPVAVLLSGGLDSSTIARLAAAETPQGLDCISIEYPPGPLDESHYARLVADDPARYRMHWVTPAADGLLETINAIVWHHDAPTPMRGRYPQWHVFRAASQHATVLLGGQGADELLGGYDRFIWPFLRDRLDTRLTPGSSRWPLILELVQLGRVSKGIHRLLPPLVLAALTARLRARLPGNRTAADGAPALALQSSPQAGPFESRLNNALWTEFNREGLPELLHGEDALSMAFSLESRLPFLDHRVVEFCFSLNYGEKIADGWTKSLLRRATVGILPEGVRLRRPKLGFPGDFAGWLGSGAGLDAVRGLLLERATLERGALNAEELIAELGGSRDRAGRWIRRHPQQTWRNVTFELWCRQFLDADPYCNPLPSIRRRNARPSEWLKTADAAA